MDAENENPTPTNPAFETMTAPLHERRPERPAGAEPAAGIHLEVVGGPMDGITSHVSASALTIGRSPRNDLALGLDPMVSTVHARIVQDGTSFWLEDLGSRNGTYIGEQRIQGRTLIGPGTLFVLGSTCLEFMPG